MSESKKKITVEDKVKAAQPYLNKWNDFVEDTMKILLAYGTKEQKNISVTSRSKTKKIMREASAEIKALFYKFASAETVITENGLEEPYKELYAAMIKDALG